MGDNVKKLARLKILLKRHMINIDALLDSLTVCGLITLQEEREVRTIGKKTDQINKLIFILSESNLQSNFDKLVEILKEIGRSDITEELENDSNAPKDPGGGPTENTRNDSIIHQISSETCEQTEPLCEIIQEYWDQMISCLNVQGVFTHLVKSGVLQNRDEKEINTPQKEEEKRVILLMKILTKIDFSKFEKFLEALAASGQKDLSELLSLQSRRRQPDPSSVLGSGCSIRPLNDIVDGNCSEPLAICSSQHLYDGDHGVISHEESEQNSEYHEHADNHDQLRRNLYAIVSKALPQQDPKILKDLIRHLMDEEGVSAVENLPHVELQTLTRFLKTVPAKILHKAFQDPIAGEMQRYES
ncbi:unnamed protein product [Darwinula stevensoni]|uniref:CARD domain-containing protein n=1 Tax=Darwinula stevensoni TaxID=69355 RepID=A0A7R9A4G7_9CRUS|nr:unnamed protein product [Darwinula stevensoni]CAG0892518.1 unnamed protein product [Darwinula stevensoni]